MLVDKDMSQSLTLQGAEHLRKAKYFYGVGEVEAASHQISCWHDCECWLALISGINQPPPPKQLQYYFDGADEAPPKEISEFDLLLSQLRESYPRQIARYLVSISCNYRKACDLFYMGEQSKAQAQLRMGWRLLKAMLQSENLQLSNPPRDISFYFADQISPDHNIKALLIWRRQAAISVGKVQAAAYFEVARQEYAMGRMQGANFHLNKWWTQLAEIARLEARVFSGYMLTADYYFGNGGDAPPYPALVPRKPKPGADPTAISLALPTSNQ